MHNIVQFDRWQNFLIYVVTYLLQSYIQSYNVKEDQSTYKGIKYMPGAVWLKPPSHSAFVAMLVKTVTI